MDSVRKQWAQQRKGAAGHPAGSSASSSGSHFAAGSEAAEKKAGRTPAAAKTSVAMPARSNNAADAGHAQRHLKIVGASGEMPAVPVHIRRSEALPYSRYNKRYTSQAPAASPVSSVRNLFANDAVEGVPVYGWLPYGIFGAAGALASIVWLVVVRLVLAAPLKTGDMAMTAGLAIFCVIVAAGVALALATAAISLRNDDDLVREEALTLALAKVAPMMVADTVVWILAMGLAAVAVG